MTAQPTDAVPGSSAQPREPLRVVQVGAGEMGEAWLANLAASADVTLVGLVDLDLDRARAAADRCGHTSVPVAANLSALLDREPEAVVDVTVPAAHPSVDAGAMRSGLPVLSEKPLAATVAECLATVAVAELTGQLLMVSQSRRYWRALDALRSQVAVLGRIGTLSCTFARAPRFPGYREAMAYPLLVDLAIHHFDLARLLVGSDPVSVSCESYNPPWSWFAGDAAAVATFTFPDGGRFAFTGSWVAAGLPTSWNGQWRVSAENGSAVWDGESAPEAVLGSDALAARAGTGPEEIAGSLAEFVAAVRGGPTPDTVGRRNVHSVAMVEAAIASAEAGVPVSLAEVLESAYVEAVRAATDPAVRQVLQSWPSVHEALADGPSAASGGG